MCYIRIVPGQILMGAPPTNSLYKRESRASPPDLPMVPPTFRAVRDPGQEWMPEPRSSSPSMSSSFTACSTLAAGLPCAPDASGEPGRGEGSRRGEILLPASPRSPPDDREGGSSTCEEGVTR